MKSANIHSSMGAAAGVNLDPGAVYDKSKNFGHAIGNNTALAVGCAGAGVVGLGVGLVLGVGENIVELGSTVTNGVKGRLAERALKAEINRREQAAKEENALPGPIQTQIDYGTPVPAGA